MQEQLFLKLNFTDDLVKSVKKVLGIEFEDLKEFFKREFFSFKKNKATILITRRCSLLAIFFLNYIFKYEITQGQYTLCADTKEFPFVEQNGVRNYLFTDKTDVSNIMRLAIEEIVVVDDICIHGNTLGNFADDLVEQLRNIECEVYTHVYMISKETIARCPDEYSKVACRAAWCALSQRIVNAIILFNIPYVSYINTWTTEISETGFNKFLELIKNSSALLCDEYDLEQNISKKCYFIAEKEALLSSTERMKCFRLYYNSETQTMVFVPFVILLKNYTNIEGFFHGEDVLKSVQLGETDKLSLLTSNDENAKKDFLYNLFSCSESYFYGLYFIEKYLKIKKNDLDEKFIQDITGCIRMAFGKSLLDFFVNYDWSCEEYCAFYSTNSRLYPSEFNVSPNIVAGIKRKVGDYILSICRDSWLDLELNSYSDILSNSNDEKGYLYIQDVIADIQEVIANWLSEFGGPKNQKGEKEQEIALTKSFAFMVLIKLCDMGRMNIGTYHNKGIGMLKAGELGYVLAKKALHDDSFSSNMSVSNDAQDHNSASKDDINRILFLRRNSYYRCLL